MLSKSFLTASVALAGAWSASAQLTTDCQPLTKGMYQSFLDMMSNLFLFSIWHPD